MHNQQNNSLVRANVIIPCSNIEPSEIKFPKQRKIKINKMTNEITLSFYFISFLFVNIQAELCGRERGGRVKGVLVAN